MNGHYEVEFTWKLQNGTKIDVLAQGEVFKDFDGLNVANLKLEFDVGTQWIDQVTLAQVYCEEYKIECRATEVLSNEARMSA